MSVFDSLFIADVSQVRLVTGQHDGWLVLLSVLVAVSASFFALRLAETARYIVIKRYHYIAQFSGAAILAGGIWSMHFIGMLAFNMPHQMRYDPSLTALSLLPAIIASYSVIKSLVMDQDTVKRTLTNGVVVGAGIGAMHYIGMAAMEMHLTLKYNPYLFVASIFVAVVLASVALAARATLRRLFPTIASIKIKLVAALIMGCAISGMHYTGMAAAYFIDELNRNSAYLPTQADSFLGYAVAFFSLIIFVLAVNVNAQLRYRQILVEKTSSEARLQAILNTATDGVMTINRDGTVEEFNASATRIFGWSEQALKGQHVSVLLPDPESEHYSTFLLDNLTPDSVCGNRKEIQVRHKHGHLVPVVLGMGHIELEAGEQLFVGFVSDISERKAMEDRISKSEERLSSLIRNIPGVSFRCLLDEEWTPLFLSDAMLELNGHSAASFLSGERSFGAWVHPDDLPGIYEFFKDAVGQKDTYEIEYRTLHRTGQVVWVLESGTIVYDENQNAKWLDGVMLDITNRKEMEGELREAKLKAEDAAESKASFLANMSHEIRTPMNAIIGFSDILLDSELPSDARKHLQTINQSAQSLLHLLNDILDSAKLEKSKLEVEFIPFKVATCVDTVVSTLWLQAKNKGLTLTLNVTQDTPPIALGAEDRIRQVLMNLVGNGIKFTEHGSVDLRVEPTPGRPGWVRFSVSDTGIGIAEDRVNAIFEAFTQADASMSRRFGGTGLGTTISKQLVELMGGEINATSRLGQGSCFYFDIPLSAAHEHDLQETSQVLQLPTLSVLIADDIEENITLLTLVLQKQGHTVIQARDGAEAVEAFKAHHPDIILMDIQMPKMDGLEASSGIREYEKEVGREAAPIIALTASVLLEDRLQAKAAGMTGFANKPVDVAQLTQEMARVLELDAATLTTLSTPTTSVANNAFTIVHLGKGMELWGDHALYVAEVIKFYNKYQESVAPLKDWVLKNQWQVLADHAHAVKGVSGNLALLPLHQLYAQLEHSALHQQGLEASRIIDDIVLSWSVLQSETKRLEAANSTESIDTEAKNALSSESLVERLTEWLRITESGQIDDELTEQIQHGAKGDALTFICLAIKAIDEFEFDVAAERIREARSSV